jgi:mono/diheme cytochrome c family protein
MWILFAMLLFPFGFAGWALGHYTSLGGKPSGAKTVTLTVTATGPSSTTTASTAPASTAPPITKTGATTASSSVAGNIAQGKAVFLANGCGSCHAFAPAGTSGTIGPNLATAPTVDAKTNKMPLAAFVKQSIVDPNAYISPGYPKNVMPKTFGSTLSKAQLADLVAFVVGGAR